MIGGKKNRRYKKKNTNSNITIKAPLKEKEQEYALVIKLLGDRRVNVKILNNNTTENVEIQAQIPGKFRNRIFINKDDIVLIQIRSFQKDKADVIYKYSIDEVNQLKKNNEFKINTLDDVENNDLIFISEEDNAMDVVKVDEPVVEDVWEDL